MEPDKEELSRLASEAVASDAARDQVPVVPGAPEEVKAPPIDSIAEARAILSMIMPIVKWFWPWLRGVLTDDDTEDMAQALGPVLAHYGITAGEFLTHPLAVAAMATLPLGARIYTAYQAQQKPAPIEWVSGEGDPVHVGPPVLVREPD